MSGGIAIFLLLVILVVAIGAFLAYSGVGASLWNRQTKRDSDDPEAQARFERGERPEHTRVEDPGNHTSVGGR